MSYAQLPDVLKIINHAYAIFGPIPLIQMVQFIARKAVTTEAVLNSDFRYFNTVLDPAREAGLRFETVPASTAGTRFSISRICTTEAAVHSAGSDQRRENRICLWRSFWHRVCVPGWLMWGTSDIKILSHSFRYSASSISPAKGSARLPWQPTFSACVITAHGVLVVNM
jgi:hypothetical protein